MMVRLVSRKGATLLIIFGLRVFYRTIAQGTFAMQTAAIYRPSFFGPTTLRPSCTRPRPFWDFFRYGIVRLVNVSSTREIPSRSIPMASLNPARTMEKNSERSGFWMRYDAIAN